MGRAPCCDKANVKKGPWSPEEDAKLKSYIEQQGTGGNWIALPQKIGLKRCGKSCRLRWLNYLRPNIKHGGFSEEEDNIICSLYISIGSRWSIIAAQLPGRTDNDIKNYWNTRLKKKLLGSKQRKSHLRGSSAHTRATTAQFMKQQETLKRPAMTGITVNGSMDYQYAMNNTALTDHQIVNPYSDDQASIRKLLIKLGGRFSNDLDHHQYRHDDHTPVVDYAAKPNTDATHLVIPQVFHEFSDNNMIQYGNAAYDENPRATQMLEGSEFLYNGMEGSSSCTVGEDIIGWGEMSSLLYNNGGASELLHDYNDAAQTQDHQHHHHHCVFGESSFTKPQ